jgi:hypothetical protein
MMLAHDLLQDMFARLRVNATIADGPVKAQRAILQDIGPLEALLLDRIYQGTNNLQPTIRTATLPNEYSNQDDSTDILPSLELQLALWNLARLGCLEPGGGWGVAARQFRL